MALQKYTKEWLSELCAESRSYKQVLEKAGRAYAGGNYSQLKRKIAEFEIDISHFTGQGWRKDEFDYTWMRKGIKYHSRFRESLIHLRGNKCECCGLEEWLDNAIPLEVHHNDNDSFNNEDENLQLLCPNCHYFTDGYRNRNMPQ